MKINPKMKEQERPTINVVSSESQGFNDRLDVLKFAADVHSRLKKDVKQDLTLAKLNDKDKEFVIEMTCNAYFCKGIMDTMALTPTLTKQEKDYITATAEAVFEGLMVKPTMIILTNRNVKDNYLIKDILGSTVPTEQGIPDEQLPRKETVTDKAKKALAPEN